MNIKVKLTLIIIAIIILTSAYYSFKKYNFKQSEKFAPVVVSTTTVNSQNWESSIQFNGEVKAYRSIQLSSEISGIVSEINFKSGGNVEAGQKVITLKSDDVQALISKVQHQLQNDEINYQRRKALLPSHYISQADVDNAYATVAKEKAELEFQQSILKKHTILAPFTGKIGISNVEIGQYIRAGQPIVILENNNPIYVDFYVPEKLIHLLNLNKTIYIKTIAYPEIIFTGKIIAISPAIDPNTRSLPIRAIVSNPNNQLFSGMSVIIHLNQITTPQLIIPQSALTYTPNETGVYIIDQKNISHWRPVVVGDRKNNSALIISGLKAGETIVTAGQMKLQEVTPVNVNNTSQLIS